MLLLYNIYIYIYIRSLGIIRKECVGWGLGGQTLRMDRKRGGGIFESGPENGMMCRLQETKKEGTQKSHLAEIIPFLNCICFASILLIQPFLNAI